MADDENVINLRPRGGGSPPGLPPLPTGPPPTPPLPSAPLPEPSGSGAAPSPGRVRRSAADSLTAATTTPPPLPAVPGAVPATFRSDSGGGEDQGQRPGLGALSLSALLAVALAAVRGTAGAVEDWRQRRMERATEAAPLRQAALKQKLAEQEAVARHGLTMQGIDQQGAQQQAKHRQSLAESHQADRRGGDKGGSAAGGKGGSSGPDPVAVERAKRDTAQQTTADKLAAAKQQARHADQAAARQQAVKDADDKRSAKAAARQQAEKDADARRAAKAEALKARGKGADASSGKGGDATDPVAAAKAKQQVDRQQAADKLAAAKAQEKLAAKSDARKQAAKDADAARTAAARKPGAKDDRTGDKTAAARAAIDLEKAKQETARAKGAAGAQKAGTKKAGDKTEDKAKQKDKDQKEKDKGQKAKEKKAGPSEKEAPGKPGGGPKDAGQADDPTEPTTDSQKPAGGEESAGAGWAPPPRGQRRSARESMRDATAHQADTITVERADRPGDAERPRPAPAAVTPGVAGLPRAPHRPDGARPGTTAPTRGTTVSAPSVRLPGTTPGEAAEHMTEVTLDDVLDHLADSKDACFDTYDECAVLASKAGRLQSALEELAEDLAQHHNVVGRLTSAAMDRLAESMDLLARTAEEMRTESLAAAEAVEVAHDEMHDAYRPVQQATADAGLHMPSARIHNEE